jgi:hypothetical protein
MTAPSLEAIHAVHQAATKLTLTCTEIVGPLEMSIAMPTAQMLGERLPPRFLRAISKLNRKDPTR